jgi:uncharacterized protein (TIGR00251 family)
MASINGRLNVHLTPRASRDQVDGWREGVLRVRVAAPPVDGRANEALIRVIAAALKIAPSRVRVVGGAASRIKLIEVDGMSGADVNRAIASQLNAVRRPTRSPAE